MDSVWPYEMMRLALLPCSSVAMICRTNGPRASRRSAASGCQMIVPEVVERPPELRLPRHPTIGRVGQSCPDQGDLSRKVTFQVRWLFVRFRSPCSGTVSTEIAVTCASRRGRRMRTVAEASGSLALAVAR
jgi:hypothetical protein